MNTKRLCSVFAERRDSEVSMKTAAKFVVHGQSIHRTHRRTSNSKMVGWCNVAAFFTHYAIRVIELCSAEKQEQSRKAAEESACALWVMIADEVEIDDEVERAQC